MFEVVDGVAHTLSIHPLILINLVHSFSWMDFIRIEINLVVTGVKIAALDSTAGQKVDDLAIKRRN